jgi:hypothetical protein
MAAPSRAIESRQASTWKYGVTVLSQSEVNDLEEELRSDASERRDSKRESTLLRRVRALHQTQRLAVMALLLELKAPAAFAFIDRAQLSRSDYLAIFRQGLIKGNASSVKFWMEVTVPHLGLAESLFSSAGCVRSR